MDDRDYFYDELCRDVDFEAFAELLKAHDPFPLFQFFMEGIKHERNRRVGE